MIEHSVTFLGGEGRGHFKIFHNFSQQREYFLLIRGNMQRKDILIMCFPKWCYIWTTYTMVINKNGFYPWTQKKRDLLCSRKSLLWMIIESDVKLLKSPQFKVFTNKKYTVEPTVHFKTIRNILKSSFT